MFLFHCLVQIYRLNSLRFRAMVAVKAFMVAPGELAPPPPLAVHPFFNGEDTRARTAPSLPYCLSFIQDHDNSKRTLMYQ